MNAWTNTDHTAANMMADRINEAVAKGHVVTVNDRTITARWTKQPAKVWQNGSISFNVPTRQGNRVTQTWAKQGQSATVVVH